MPHHSVHHHIHVHFNKKLEKKLIKRLALILSIVEIVATIPQLYDVWIKHQTAGVSLITWSLWTASALVWLLYGLQIKDKPLIISNALWLLVEGAVTVGILIYG